MKNGSFSNNFITAEIINLATKKIITIKETHFWYAGNVAAFDADSFASAIDSLSSSITFNTSAPSGSGGGGGSGGRW